MTYSAWLTPANAGTTNRNVQHTLLSEAHPRECGDDIERYFVRRRRPGSPPRMRGRRDALFENAADSGLTPANAGTTV